MTVDWMLVLHEDALVRSTAAGLLKEVCAETVHAAANLDDARELFNDHGRAGCRLVVSSLSPPLNADASPALDRSQATAIKLLKEIRGSKEVPPWLFLVSFDDGTRAPDLAGIVKVEALNVLDIAYSLRKMALALTGRGGAMARRADVDITLMDGVCTWSLRGTGGTAVERSGVIDVDPKELRALAEASSQAALVDRKGLGQIGLGLYVQLLANTLKSELALALAGAVGESVQDARFRFCVDDDTNQVLLEALGKPLSVTEGAQLDHWMLRAPIFRKYRGNGGRYPLFKDRDSQSQPVSCLIIQGASTAFRQNYRMANGETVPVDYRGIGQAATEAGKLFAYLDKNQKPFGLAQPVLLQPEKQDDYGKVVRATLASRQWQMIHYVGHSSMSPLGTAFLALGSGAKDALELAELARLASSAQFVFLSSCRSSNAQFVRELVARNIPAVLGYAWPVGDVDASRFADLFYYNLFNDGQSRRFLEYAFMRSKCAMHTSQPDETAWAAPLLFMQMLGSEARTH